jgi:hypothetical protein
MTRNILAAVLALAGLGLACQAALDWVSYTGFTFSLVWK